MDVNSNDREECFNDNLETEEACELKKAVQLLDIPFNWNLTQPGVHAENVIGRLEEKDEEIADPLDFKFRNLILQILLAYEYFNLAESLCDAEKTRTRLTSLQKLKDCENILQQHKQTDCKDMIYIVTHKPLLNIIYGIKTYVMVKCGMISEAKETLKHLERLSDLNQNEKAAMFGIKASLLMEYGNEKFPQALEIALSAKNLDPSIGEWHFLVGNLMARIRRVKFFMDVAQENEISALEKAVEITGYSRYKLHLAQTYREEAFRIFNTYRYDVKKNLDKAKQVEDINRKACYIYKNLINENPEDARLLARCAFGITKLPLPFRDVTLAQKAIEKALALSPNNPMINHYIAIIYERFLNNVEKAEKYYKIASDLCVFGAAMDFIRLKFSQNPKEYDPVPYLKEISGKFLEKDRYFQALSQIASYYFFHKNDIPEAFKYIEEISASNPDHSSLRTHKSLTLRMNDPCDLCLIVFDEVKLRIAQEKYDNIEQKETLLKIGCALRKLCPDSDRFYYNHLKNKILDKSKALLEGPRRNTKKTKCFGKKGKGKKYNSNSKVRKNVDQTPSSYRDRSKSSCGSNQQKTGNRASSKDNKTKNLERYPSKCQYRDRSKSTNKNSNQGKVFANNANYRKQENKTAKKNQNSCENLAKPCVLKFSDEDAKKWQHGSDGFNTGLDLQWYGPYFKPKPRNSYKSNISLSKLDKMYYSKDDNRCFRTQSLDRFNSGLYSRGGNIMSKKNMDSRNSYVRNRIYEGKYQHKYSSENISARKSSIENLSKFQNYHGKNVEKQNQEKNFEKESCGRTKQERCSKSLPPSRDSSVESLASIFLPKFASQTSIQKISDNK